MCTIQERTFCTIISIYIYFVFFKYYYTKVQLYNNYFIPTQNIHNEMELPDRMVRFRFFFCKSKLSIRLNEGQCQSKKLRIMYMIFIRIVQKSRPEMTPGLPGKKNYLN